MRTALIAAATLLLSSLENAHAQSVDTFVIANVSSCGLWLDARKAGGRNAQFAETWLAGYASGFAVGRNKDYWRTVDSASLLHAVDKYCRDNPLSGPVAGVQNLSLQTEKR